MTIDRLDQIAAEIAAARVVHRDTLDVLRRDVDLSQEARVAAAAAARTVMFQTIGRLRFEAKVIRLARAVVQALAEASRPANT